MGSTLWAQTDIPSTFRAFGDDFEGSLENWFIPTGHSPSIGASAGRSGSGGLKIALSQEENHIVRGNRRHVARAAEAYLTFWFHPNGANIGSTSGFIPTRSLRVAAIQGPDRKSLVGLRVYDTGLGYEGYLEWHDGSSNQYDYSTGSFPVANAYQEVTIGFRRGEWVAAWINGSSVRSISSGVTHGEPHGSVIEVGKTNGGMLISPTGTLRFDNVELALPRIGDLWVDAASGSDSNNGLSPGNAFATISKASDLAGAGTVVHIQPGTYREAIVPAQGGLDGEPVVYQAESGPGTVLLRGSEPSSTLVWTQLGSNTIGLPPGVDPAAVWWADLSSWPELDPDKDGVLAPPLFVVRMNSGGDVAERLPTAREPDWTVSQPRRYSRLWWTANGGSVVASCDPTVPGESECDAGDRSETQLTDTADDTQPAAVEPGNLGSLGDLTGAVLRAQDAYWGHRHCVRRIVAHNVPAARVTVSPNCLESDGDPGLGWGSKYYVEQHPALLDMPGEWWFNEVSGRLYLWPPSPGSPSGQPLEISRRASAFNLRDRSHVTLDALDLELYNGTVIENKNFEWHLSVGNTISRCRLRYGEIGILLSQTVAGAGSHEDKRIEKTILSANEILRMDNKSIYVTYLWQSSDDPDLWHRPGVFDTVISGNTISHIGHRTPLGDTGALGSMLIWYADTLEFVENRISDTAQEAATLVKSVIQSPASWDFLPSEIQTGRILVKDNVIERACQMKSDCGALHVTGSPPEMHVFRDLLIVGNILRDTLGWSWAAEHRNLWSAAEVPGAGGMGLYLTNASNVHAFRNVMYSNGFAGAHLAGAWRDGSIHLYNNVAADNAIGIHQGGLTEDTHNDVDTRVLNNIFVNNSAYGIQVANVESSYPNIEVDRNLYFSNGWGQAAPNPGAMRIRHGIGSGQSEHWQTLAEIQANTPFEPAGQAGNPDFVDYDVSDHSFLDGSRPDFRLLTGSVAEDAGTQTLSDSLTSVLGAFSVPEDKIGLRFDQGAFEGTIVCEDVVKENMTVTSVVSYIACGWLILGPDFHVSPAGRVTAVGGKGVKLIPNITVKAGGSLELGSD